MELFIFARFHAHEGRAAEVDSAIREVLGPTRQEPGCIEINAFRSTRDPRLCFIHSRWIDEAAFDHHAELPHTQRFVQKMEPLIDHPFEAARTAKFE